jgi:cobalamin synthase
VWSAIGAILAALGAAAAFVRARYPAGPYDDEYGMTARSHRRFGWVSVAFAVLFGVTALVPAIPPVPIAAVYVLLLILYATSFLRGFADR